MSSHRGLRIIGLIRALVPSSGSILVSLPLCFFCNSRTDVITLDSGHVCDILCVNASVLITRMDLG
jgi:hypothetical protein